MVDKENQWDDIEYTGDEADYEEAEDTQEDYSDEEYESEEYSDEEYSEEYEDGEYEDEEYEDEEYEEEEGNERKGSAVPLIAVLLIILLLAGGGYFAYTKFFSGSGTIAKSPAQTNNESIHIENQQQEMNQEPQAPQNENNTQDMGDFFFNEAGGNDSDMMSIDFNDEGQKNIVQPQDQEQNNENQNNEEPVVATVTEQPDTSANELSPEDVLNEGGFNASEENGDNAIMVTYNKETRLNPFKPPIIDKNSDYDEINETGFEIIEPPTSSIQDENLKRLLQTQISGILYDEVSPSAIVNLNGTDQFVKIGDEVFGYRIEDITRDKVQISYKNNSYVASVGELFTRGLLEKKPAVANFENKFAGRYRENN